jgi:hypothetical protein
MGMTRHGCHPPSPPPPPRPDLVEWGPATNADEQFVDEVIAWAPNVPALQDDRPINEYFLLRRLQDREYKQTKWKPPCTRQMETVSKIEPIRIEHCHPERRYSPRRICAMLAAHRLSARQKQPR